MKGLMLMFMGIGHLYEAFGVTHSLKHFYTASSEVHNFPEFMVVGMVDDVQMVHYDSNSQKAVPKQDWMKQTDAEFWEKERENFFYSQQSFKAEVATLKQHFNQSGGVHILQYMYGCSRDDETEQTEGFGQLGYNGENFLEYDMKTLTWKSRKQQANFMQDEWNRDISRLGFWKIYFSQTCIDCLKKQVDNGKSTLMRTVPPSVSLLQKTPSSPVTCHATGFYPSGVMVSWQKDGQEQHEDVLHGEILLNGDGTFQKSAHLTIDSEKWENNNYTCVVEHKENIIAIRLNQSVIKTNSVKPSEYVPIIIGLGVVAVILLVLVPIITFIMWNRKSTASDDGSNPSMTQQNQIQLEVSLSLIKQEEAEKRGPLLKDSEAS